MAMVLQEIIEWADKSLKYWEQASLDKLIAGKSLVDNDYEQLLQYFLEDNHLTEKTTERSELGFQLNLHTLSQEPSEHPKLRSLHDLEGVNALAKGQRIEFSDQLTVIYGLNGSGKSGYARVLGCAGFTRGDREILKDVLSQSEIEITTSARLDIEDSNGVRELTFLGESLPEVSRFYMFDSSSVDVHLTKQTELTFSPFGLGYLKQLVEVTDRIRDSLNKLIQSHRQPHQFRFLFKGETEVSKIIGELNENTDISVLEELSIVSPEEKTDFINLEREIARLKSLDVAEEIEKTKKSIEDISDLIAHILEAKVGLSDQLVATIQQLLVEYQNIQVTIKTVGLGRFHIAGLTQIGTPVWSKFIQSAHELAHSESSDYPSNGENCLLCGQTLSQDSRELIHNLWEFLEAGSQSKLIEAKENIGDIRDSLSSIDLDFLTEDTVNYRFLTENYPEIMPKAELQLEYLRNRKLQLLNALEDYVISFPVGDFAPDVISDLESIINNLQDKMQRLQEQDVSNQIIMLEKQANELNHRIILEENFPQIAQQVQSLQWAQRASKTAGNSAKLTQKHNELFGKYVTAEFISKFEDTLNRLGRPLKVRVGTTSRKGQTYRQIVLQNVANQPVSEAKADRVLSEGEKRAVAFADFLTEVALDQHSCGIILDDPVTSLDYEWREAIAELLVAEASKRQVIIFTHDLPFLHQLKTHAEKTEVSTQWHQIIRGNDDTPGFVYLESSPALEREYKGTILAQNKCKQAKECDDRPVDQLNLLRQGFDALRASYEYLIMYDLFGEVVVRFSDRISVDRLNRVVVTKEVATEIINRYGTVSRYITGHLHGDMTPVKPPSITTLEDEINAHEDLRGKIKSLKKGN